MIKHFYKRTHAEQILVIFGLAIVAQEIGKTLERIKALGMTTIIVEQNAIAALHLADHAIILDMGQVAFDGTAREVLDNEDLRHEYLAI